MFIGINWHRKDTEQLPYKTYLYKILILFRYNIVMKRIKSMITFSLLFALSFSIVHEYAFAFYDEEHCNTAEYVQELQGPVIHETESHDINKQIHDICDIHFEYHQAFVLLPNMPVLQNHDLRSNIILTKETYQFHSNLKFIKPPIA